MLRISLSSLLVLIIVIAAALLAMSVTGREIKAQARESVTGQPEVTGEPHVVAYNQHNLIRFHVIANSDSDRDQALKRRVRDLIVQRMAPEFSKAKGLSDARNTAKAHLEEIKQIALTEVNSWGENYPVSVQLGKFDFPVKTYGKLTLPAGNYEAVRVVIGQGQGANWWCVLFPPLCFVDVSRAITPVSQEVDETVYVQQNTAELEAGSLNQTRPGAMGYGPQSNVKERENVKIRFKILELLGW